MIFKQVCLFGSYYKKVTMNDYVYIIYATVKIVISIFNYLYQIIIANRIL